MQLSSLTVYLLLPRAYNQSRFISWSAQHHRHMDEFRIWALGQDSGPRAMNPEMWVGGISSAEVVEGTGTCLCELSVTATLGGEKF